MALNIEGATIGYDADNVEKALNNLEVNCINATIDKMNSSMSTLFDAVNAAWVGVSANQFMENMSYDKDQVVQALRETYDVLKGEIDDIVAKMAAMDEDLVEAREK